MSINVVVSDAVTGKPVAGYAIQALVTPLAAPNGAAAPALVGDASGTVVYPTLPLSLLGITFVIGAPGYETYTGLYRDLGLDMTIGISLPPLPPPPPTPPSSVLFDHPWTGNVELALRTILATGLGGSDGTNGQAVVDQLNAMGGIYAGAEFQPHHDGPTGFPTYGFPWFYVSYITNVAAPFYQIVEAGTPPPGD